MQLSIVMAAMNEADSIQKMLESIRQHAPHDSEIILVDSGNDGTAEIAAALGARVIKQAPAGHGAALKHGLNLAQGDVVVTMDCDLTYPIEALPSMLTSMRQGGYDLISACRMTSRLKKEMPFLNKLANHSFAFFVRSLFGIKTQDVTTGMFLMKKEIAHLDWRGNFSLPAEIIIRTHLLKKKYLEIPITYRDRHGMSTLPKWRSGKAYLRCFLYWKWGWFKTAEL